MHDASSERLFHYFEFFVSEHYPEELRNVCEPFRELATVIVNTLTPGPERTVALRKLLESRDCALRAMKWPGN